ISLAPTTSRSLTWTVTPTAVGLYTLAFTAGNASQQIGVSIVSGNGFSPIQPQTFNYVAIFVGLLITLACVMVFVWRRSPQPQSPNTTEDMGARREQPLPAQPAQPASAAPSVRSEDASHVAV
ncbi:MAG TPA: hypothetical protein VKQ30_18745, partial [Ktedonobacterales bacterium]|nr:hypothetical protein [Ktedonobacterales bacterium]